MSILYLPFMQFLKDLEGWDENFDVFQFFLE